ncbi:MAG: class I SAM-dependent methyltransferase [Arachidicoccus sp.]|nr:class I SAM-dependent methyltransferase [Arachidicoccus sp.]
MSIVHYTHCPVCKSSDIHFVLSAKDYTVSGTLFQIFECGKCTLRFTQDVPDLMHIGNYYKSENYISHTNTSKGIINKLYQKVRNRTMKQKASIIFQQTGKQKGNILDIGCGTGTFLHTMLSKGWAITGIEPDEDARKNAIDLYGIKALQSDELFSLKENSFDAITMWHVLEHVHALHDYINHIKKLLKPDGKIVIAVPNYTSKDAQIYKEYWAAYDVPRHLYHFSPKAMKDLMELHQLKVVKILPMWYDSFYVSMLSSKYKNGSTNFAAAGLNGLKSNINAMQHSENCSSVIYIIEK